MMWGVGMAPHKELTKKMFVSPIAVSGLGKVGRS